MKISHVCTVVSILLMLSAMAFADSIDPKIIIHNVTGITAPCSPEKCKDVGLNFSFGVPSSGVGSDFFTNTSGLNWTSLKLIEVQPIAVPAIDIVCSTSLFKSCTAITLKNGSVEILLQGVKNSLNADRGIRNGQSFAIQFSCIKKDCWPGGLDFKGHASATTVPEPGTVALLVTGLSGIFVRRKQWRNRFTV